jgi:hypothetical protein
MVPPRPWQPAVVLRDASLPAFRTIGTEETVVFVHSMNTPSGKPILIAVILADRQQHGLESTTNDRKVFQVFPRSMIYAIEVRDDGTAPKLGELTEAQEDMPQAEVIWHRGKSNYAREEAAVTFTTAGMLTVYAGQVDSADPSHLTIGYAIDGQRSTIDGWLRSETLLELLPRTGTIARRTNNGRSVSWNPLITPSSQPATSPAASK